MKAYININIEELVINFTSTYDNETKYDLVLYTEHLDCLGFKITNYTKLIYLLITSSFTKIIDYDLLKFEFDKDIWKLFYRSNEEKFMREVLNVQNETIDKNICDLIEFIKDDDFIELIKSKKFYPDDIKEFIYKLYHNHLDKSLKYVIDNRPF